MMRRSSSQSHIPLPKNSQQSLRRTNSSSHLGLPKSRSSVKTGNLGRDYGGSNSNLSSVRKDGGSVSNLGSARRGYCGSNSNLASGGLNIPGSSARNAATPRRTTTANIRLPSPAQALTTHKINDKKFSAEQFRKVCAFLEDHVDGFDPKSIKSFTLNSFVDVITLLFKEIDPRINMNMTNYKETVCKYLKMYKYPGPVTTSLLKTANTSHSWASIISILGWLVDLIRHSNDEEYEDDKLKKYMSSRFMATYKNGNSKGLFVNYIYEILDLDMEEYRLLESDLKRLTDERNKGKEINDEMKSEENKLTSQLQQMQFEINEYKNGNLEMRTKKEINRLQAELELKKAKIDEMETAVVEKKNIISGQKYSKKDLLELKKQLEDGEYTLDLKKRKLENASKIREDYELQLDVGRRQIESQIHKINGALLLLKLSLLQPDAKKIQLPDRGVYQSTFLQIVEEKRRFLQNFKEKIDKDLVVANNAKSEVQGVLKEYIVNQSKLEKEICGFKNSIESMRIESERLIFENDIERKHEEKKMKALLETAPDIDALKKKKDDLAQEYLRLENELEELSEKSIDFFRQIYEDTVGYAAEMRTMMSNILDKAHQAYEQVVNLEEAVVEQIPTEVISDIP